MNGRLGRFLVHLLKKPVYCKQCGRYRSIRYRGKRCGACGSSWRRVEDTWPKIDLQNLPWRWERSD